MTSTTKDFQVLQSYNELGEACENAVYSALVPTTTWNEAPPSDGEIKWAEEIARKARDSFLMGLDGVEDPLVDELRAELNACKRRAQAADNRYYELLGSTRDDEQGHG